VSMGKTKFKNPLLQKTADTSTETSTSTETLPSTSTSSSNEPGTTQRNRGTKAFDKTHDRLTVWINKALKREFEALATNKGISKTALINEAVADVLRKYMQR
jgi:hypothetical protein